MAVEPAASKTQAVSANEYRNLVRVAPKSTHKTVSLGLPDDEPHGDGGTGLNGQGTRKWVAQQVGMEQEDGMSPRGGGRAGGYVQNGVAWAVQKSEQESHRGMQLTERFTSGRPRKNRWISSLRLATKHTV